MAYYRWLSIAVLLCAPVFARAEATQDLQKILAAHKGEVIYLDFWASWCAPCRKSFPWLNAMHSKYKGQGFHVIAVNVDADAAEAQQFLQDMPANFSVLYDPDGSIAQQFKLKGMPSSFLIDQQGQIIDSHVGFFDNKKTSYEQQILTLLKG